MGRGSEGRRGQRSEDEVGKRASRVRRVRGREDKGVRMRWGREGLGGGGVRVGEDKGVKMRWGR